MKIAILNTGGTISCSGTPLAPMSAADFAGACRRELSSHLQQRFAGLSISYVTDLIFPASASHTLDSSNIQPADWCQIADHILQHYDDYDGWVILHGTDSLAYSAAALPMLLTSFDSQGRCTALLNKAVVITGAQRPLFAQAAADVPLRLNAGSDALNNLYGAIACAQSGLGEVAVFFDGQLLRGNRAIKIHTSANAAFASPNYPPLARYDGQLRCHKSASLRLPATQASLAEPALRAGVIAQLNHIRQHIDACPVMLFPAFPASYDSQNASALIAELIEGCVARGVKGLLLASYGAGNFPSGNPHNPRQGAIYRALKAADAAGVVIVNGSQVSQGSVTADTYAAGAWLSEVGAISSADMTLMAAFSKLMLLLACAEFHGWSQAGVKQLMQQNLLGEMLSNPPT